MPQSNVVSDVTDGLPHQAGTSSLPALQETVCRPLVLHEEAMPGWMGSPQEASRKKRSQMEPARDGRRARRSCQEQPWGSGII